MDGVGTRRGRKQPTRRSSNRLTKVQAHTPNIGGSPATEWSDEWAALLRVRLR
jgi:hypothetical protein